MAVSAQGSERRGSQRAEGDDGQSLARADDESIESADADEQHAHVLCVQQQRRGHGPGQAAATRLGRIEKTQEGQQVEAGQHRDQRIRTRLLAVEHQQRAEREQREPEQRRPVRQPATQQLPADQQEDPASRQR